MIWLIGGYVVLGLVACVIVGRRLRAAREAQQREEIDRWHDDIRNGPGGY